jgi:hypothetical protein
MTNQSTHEGVTPIEFDFSHGSNNPYTVEARHGLIPPCIHCGVGSIVKLDGSEYFAYFNRGIPVAQAFPTLSLDQRELLITGTHPQCWDALFADEDDVE